MRTCTGCGGMKPLDEFYRNKKGRDGRYSRCRVCAKASVEESQARRRLEVGDEAWRAKKRAIVAAHRARMGTERDKAYSRARHRALETLRQRHLDEFEALMATELALEGLDL